MTHYTDADLEMADRHIAEGEQHIIGQEEVLAGLRAKGLPTEEAEKLLRLFHKTQVLHREHRDAIATALEEARSRPSWPLRVELRHHAQD